MRTKLVTPAFLLALVLVLLGLLFVARHGPRLSNFGQIRLGMTEAQVEELLGAKAGYYDGFGQDLVSGRAIEGFSKQWCSRHGSIIVWFDKDSRVRGYRIVCSQPVTWWAKVWHRFHSPQRIDIGHDYRVAD